MLYFDPVYQMCPDEFVVLMFEYPVHMNKARMLLWGSLGFKQPGFL